MAGSRGALAAIERMLCRPGRARRGDPIEELVEDYVAETRMAAQLRAHADRAPYPRSAAALRSLAAVEDRHAAWLQAEIEARQARAEPWRGEVAGGRNHWERLRRDLEEADRKRKRYLEQAIAWDPGYPELAELAHRIEAEEARCRAVLEELMARSDPQAID